MKLLDGLFTWTVDTSRLAAGRPWKGNNHVQMFRKVLEYSEEGELRRKEVCQQNGMATVKEGGILSVKGSGWLHLEVGWHLFSPSLRAAWKLVERGACSGFQTQVGRCVFPCTISSSCGPLSTCSRPLAGQE